MFAIYNNIGVAENKGGPAGYLFNLNCGLQAIDKKIEILSDFSQQDAVTNKKRQKVIAFQIWEEIRSILYFFKRGLYIKMRSKNKWKKYGVLHIESIEDAYYIKKIVGFKGKIILSPHRPETMADEKISMINLKNNKNWDCRLLKRFYNYVESSVYSFSNAFVFPSKGAEEIYNMFPGYKVNKYGKPIKYVYTGCCKKEVSIDSRSFREKYGLSEEDFVISYIGRHNYIKGYDLLADIGEELVASGVGIICAGAISSIKYPISKKWIELGYIFDVQNLINASDIVVVPNRNTYFDLVIIEILSLGKIVVTSRTGGNKDIAKETDGLILFESGNKKELLRAINEVSNFSNEERARLEKSNLEFYRKYCSPSVFAENYVSCINEIFYELNINEVI